MNKRQSKILKVLYNTNAFMTFAQIAEQMEVSVKTVRNDIGFIKEYLTAQNAGEIETRPHVGVRLNITDEQWKSLDNGGDDEDREIAFFIIKSLMKDGTLTAQKLAERYFIGRTQLEKVLDGVADWFFNRHILFERRRGRGISIRYSEFNYRMAMLKFCSEFTPELEGLANVSAPQHLGIAERDYKAICAALGGFAPDKVAESIIKTEEEFGLSFNYTSGINLLFLTSLCILRNGRGIEIEMPKVSHHPTDGESGKVFADALASRLEEKYKVRLSEHEREFLVFSVDTSEISSFADDDSRRVFEAANIELCRFTVKAVNLISDIAGIDLRDDRFFVKQLFLQFKASISRLKYGIVCKNLLLTRIKTKYPNMMAIAWFMENLFHKELGLEVNEHEVGFFALHIGGAIERRLSQLTACIVCDYGIGISQILKEKITRTIPDIRITSVFSGRDTHLIKNEDCDFVIATTPLDGYRLGHDIVTIGHLLDENDIKILEDKIKYLRSSKPGNVGRIKPKTGLFNTELIFPKCKAFDKTSLLKTMCSRMEALGYVTADFEKSVLEREKTAPTDIGNGFAIPHGLGEYVNHSVVAFASLEHPIEWVENGEDVDIVLLIAFDPDEDEEVKRNIMGFYKSVVSFMEDEKACENLRRQNNKEEIIKIFELW